MNMHYLGSFLFHDVKFCSYNQLVGVNHLIILSVTYLRSSSLQSFRQKSRQKERRKVLMEEKRVMPSLSHLEQAQPSTDSFITLPWLFCYGFLVCSLFEQRASPHIVIYHASQIFQCCNCSCITHALKWLQWFESFAHQTRTAADVFTYLSVFPGRVSGIIQMSSQMKMMKMIVILTWMRVWRLQHWARRALLISLMERKGTLECRLLSHCSFSADMV